MSKTGIISKKKEELQAISNMVDETMMFAFKGDTIHYSYIIKHPSKNLYAYIVNQKDIILMQTSYPNQLSAIGVNLIDLVVELGDDWETQETQT